MLKSPMDYRTGTIGRVFLARFEDGEDLPSGLTGLAEKEGIRQGIILLVGAMKDTRLVVGPRETLIPPEPVWSAFTQGREILGFGTVVEAEDGPAVHVHLAAGRGDEEPMVGCLREAGKVYLVVEAVVLEISGMMAARKFHPDSGLNLLGFLE